MNVRPSPGWSPHAPQRELDFNLAAACPDLNPCRGSGRLTMSPDFGVLPHDDTSHHADFVSQAGDNFSPGFYIVSTGASAVPEVYNPGRLLRRQQ